jgi:hypothetical protein
MKVGAGLILAGALSASMATSTTYYALEIRGGSQVWAVDRPVQKGRVYVFHRFPDGVYTSIAAAEVEKVAPQAEPPPTERPTTGLSPGQALFVGPTLPGFAGSPAPPPAASDEVVVDPGYGSSDAYWGSGYWGGGGGWVPRPPPPSPAGPTRIGPNGFPILAHPGTPGSVPPPIGSNGFPVLAPPPVAPQPRRPQR